MSKIMIDSKFKLSILIPAYNVEEYIEECLGSIANQLNENCEIIIYDDSSSDNTLEKIQNHPIAKNKNFKIITSTTNNGVSFVRNNLINICTGDYIWFVDSDDIITERAINKILTSIEAYSPDIIFFNYIKRLENLSPDGAPIEEEIKTHHKKPGYYLTDSSTIFADVVNNGNFYTQIKIFRNSLFVEGTEFPAGRIFEDVNITPLLASLSKNFLYIDKPLYIYRQRSGSITSTITPELEIEQLRSLCNLRKRYESLHGNLGISAQESITYIASVQTRWVIRQIIKSDRKEDTSIMLKNILKIYKDTHMKNAAYVIFICIKFGGIDFTYQLIRRIVQAKIRSYRI